MHRRIIVAASYTFDLSLSGDLLAYLSTLQKTSTLHSPLFLLLGYLNQILPQLQYSHSRATIVLPHSATILATMLTSWNTQNVGYFVPNNAAQRHHYTQHEVTYFTNVHAFVNHVRALESHMSAGTIRSNIHFCLRGKALDWHDVELSPEERIDLSISPLDEGWYAKLIERFQPLERAAEYAYVSASYTLEDAKAGRDPVEWAHHILRHAQATGDTDIERQLDHIVRSIDQKLLWGVALPNPRNSNMLEKVMEELEFYYEIWRHEEDHPEDKASDDDEAL